MKLVFCSLASAVLMSVLGSVQAATLTATNLGNLAQMPGSPSDYSFVGGNGQFGSFGYGGGSPDSGIQTNFTLTSLVGESYGGDGRYSTIKNPLGTSTQTGILFGRAGNTNQNLLQLKLGTSTTFGFGDMDVDVMFGNAFGDGQVRDTALTLTDVTKGFSLTFNVTDSNSNLAEASFVQFNIIGASSGDLLRIGATSPAGLNYVGGVSLVGNVPEPSSWAITLAGLAVLVFFVRFKNAFSRP